MLKSLPMLCASLLFAASAVAATPAAKINPVAGRDYWLIEPAQPVSDQRVIVTEVFSYACPHCAHFQPYAEELKAKLPKGATFQLLPAVFQDGWEPFARAFYTAQALGVLERTHQALFDAIHRDHAPLHTLADLAQHFYANYGVDPATFLSTASSFVIEGKLADAKQLVRDYQVDATPTLIIDGKYRVTANAENGIGFAEMVQITLALVERELAAKRPTTEHKTHKTI
jgi:thiol:disulfide interchange protein DsbA